MLRMEAAVARTERDAAVSLREDAETRVEDVVELLRIAQGENERLREQMDAMAQRYNVVLDKEHALVTSLHAENARLREREARVRALCADGTDPAIGARWRHVRSVLAILDGKDGEG